MLGFSHSVKVRIHGKAARTVAHPRLSLFHVACCVEYQTAAVHAASAKTESGQVIQVLFSSCFASALFASVSSLSKSAILFSMGFGRALGASVPSSDARF
jgi:hypothetical protein